MTHPFHTEERRRMDEDVRAIMEDEMSERPWTTEALVVEDDGRSVSTASGRAVAKAWRHWSQTSGNEQTRANACLIAAAPRLFETLAAIVNHEAFEEGFISADLASKFADARAALAKALGDQKEGGE